MKLSITKKQEVHVDNRRSHSGSANANSALPWPAPSIPGRKPSVHAPHPVGTAMYCRPSTLNERRAAVVAAAALELPQQLAGLGVEAR